MTYPSAEPGTWTHLDQLNIVDRVYQTEQKRRYEVAKAEAKARLDAAEYNLQSGYARHVDTAEIEALLAEYVTAGDDYQLFLEDDLGWRDEAHTIWGR